jgi:hypothetical protein
VSVLIWFYEYTADLDRWSKFKKRKAKPTSMEPCITYMLAGAAQRCATVPCDKTSPPIPIGPHWMTMWPFDPKTTGHTGRLAPTSWAGPRYIHLQVMGRPDEKNKQKSDSHRSERDQEWIARERWGNWRLKPGLGV